MTTPEKYPRSSIEDDFNYGTNVATASVQIRMDFLRKVYTILSLQIILTTATSALFMYCDTIKDFVHSSPAVVLVSAIGSLVLIIALAFYRHQHPINLYLLAAFTLLESVSVATAVTFYEYSIVLQAFFLTAAVFLGLTAYTFQSKRDFSKLGAGLFSGLWILIIAGFMKDHAPGLPDMMTPCCPQSTWPCCCSSFNFHLTVLLLQFQLFCLIIIRPCWSFMNI
uniref:Protein lifeguard 4 n=1 Tax=Oncorhynchus tshawytscha TaxID=74940 RepID=A0A8C8FAE5_ONCTS